MDFAQYPLHLRVKCGDTATTIHISKCITKMAIRILCLVKIFAGVFEVNKVLYMKIHISDKTNRSANEC